MLNKTPLLHQSSGPRVFLSLSFSLSLRLFLWSAEGLWVHFPAWASQTLSRRRSTPSPHREGTWGLRKQSTPCARGLIGFLRKPRNVSLLLSFTFLSVDSGPPGSSPLMDPNKWYPEQELGIRRQILMECPQGLLRPVSTKTWIKWLESPITLLLYFITYLKFWDLMKCVLIF